MSVGFEKDMKTDEWKQFDDEKKTNGGVNVAEDMKDQTVGNITASGAPQETITAAGPDEKDKYKVEFNKPYMFEREEYEEIDLSGIEKMTIGDAVEIQKDLFNEDNVATVILTERTSAFARTVAAKATGLPIEFFKLMPRGANMKLKQAVLGAVSDGGDTENHIMKLKKPYYFEGKQYTEVNMSGLEDLTSMNESEAENRLIKEDVRVVDPSHNYLYACIIASMATGLSEEFFKRLPICELVNFKGAANDFFE